MKRIITICAACAALLAASSCGSKENAKVTALVKGPHTAALVIDYGQAVDPASVAPEAYAVEGEEVVCANVVEDSKVIVVLKKECKQAKPECCKEEQPDCCKEEKPDCCKEAEPKCEEAKPECEAPAIPVPDVAVQQVADIKALDGKVIAAWGAPVKATEAKPACHKKHHDCKEGAGQCKEAGHECGKHECDKPAEQKCDKCKEAGKAE